MDLSGVITAIVTPFTADDSVDFAAFEKLLEDQLDRGVAGFVPCGSTGEYYAMTAKERAETLAFAHRQVGDRAKLIAGTNGGSTREVIDHTRRARELGYEAVLLAPPYYSLPSQYELTKHFEAVADAVDVKIVLYNFPARAGVEIGWEVLDALQDDPRFIAIKESSGELLRAIEINRRYAGRMELVVGSDDQAFDFYLWGAVGWICGPGNCFADQAVAIDRHARNGELAAAQKEMRRMYAAMSSLETGKFVQKVKYGCELLGVPVGRARAPLLPLSEEEKADFRTAFEAAYA